MSSEVQMKQLEIPYFFWKKSIGELVYSSLNLQDLVVTGNT